MKKNAAILLFLILALGAFYFLAKPSKLEPKNPATQTVVQKDFSVTQKIGFGGLKEDQSTTAKAKEGETALELLARTKIIETKDYSFGKSIESIEGIKSGTDGKYWLYYVNGSQAQVGADQYKLNENDAIEWKLEKGS